MGRPTKYTDLIVAKACKYLEVYESLGHLVPSNQGLAAYLGITTQTVYDWKKQKSKRDFSYTLERLQDLQALTLINKGLGGIFNANLTKLMLVNHGYHDKQETTLSNPDGSALVNEWHIHPVTNAREGDNDRSPPE